jgi:hypothetical protein
MRQDIITPPHLFFQNQQTEQTSQNSYTYLLPFLKQSNIHDRKNDKPSQTHTIITAL